MAKNMFLESGPIVTIQGRLPEDRVVYDATAGTTIAKDIPIVVLVNGGSASASEIVAAALHDQGRAKVAGERSFGKGTIQQVFVMDGGRSGLKLTTAKYYPPSGKNIHRGPRMTETDEWGVVPDEKLNVTLTEEETRKLYQRWRNSEVPASGTSSSGNGDPSAADTLSDDPALKKAYEQLKEMLQPI